MRFDLFFYHYNIGEKEIDDMGFSSRYLLCKIEIVSAILIETVVTISTTKLKLRK